MKLCKLIKFVYKNFIKLLTLLFFQKLLKTSKKFLHKIFDFESP